MLGEDMEILNWSCIASENTEWYRHIGRINLWCLIICWLAEILSLARTYYI